jgi:hypothetical protein
LDGLGVAAQRIVGPQALEHHLGVAADDREQIVEVVGDAARVSAEGRVVGQRRLEPRGLIAGGQRPFFFHRGASSAEALCGLGTRWLEGVDIVEEKRSVRDRRQIARQRIAAALDFLDDRHAHTFAIARLLDG